MATLQHLRDYARRQARDATGTKADAMIDRAINEACAMIARERPWSWYITHGQVRVFGAVSNTATLTSGSTAGTLATAAPSWAAAAPSLTKLAVNGRWHRLAACSGTAITLTDPWPEASGSYDITIYRDEFELPADCCRLARIFPGTGWVWGGEPCGIEDILAAYNAFLSGQRIPSMWAIYRNRLAVWPWPSDDTAVNILYYRMPATLTNNTDVADWDPLHDELLLRAIDYQLALVFGPVVPGDAGACRQLYADALTRATKAERAPQWHGMYAAGFGGAAVSEIAFAP